MLIRRAENRDITQINNLLKQVCLVHHKGRPDLFKKGARKYSDDQLKQIEHFKINSLSKESPQPR